MRLTEDQMDDFEYLADELDARVRTDYSGRCMYGKICLGLTGTISSIEVGALLAERLGDIGIKMAKNARTDSMGLDIIVYFPNYQAPEDREE